MSERSARAGRYAQAVIQAMLDRWRSVLETTAEAIAGDKKLASLLADDSKSVDERAQALVDVLPDDAPAEAVNLLKLLIQNDDMDLISEMPAALQQVTTGETGPLKAEITSALELSNQDQERIRRKLIEQHGEGLVFTFRVDPAIMGGLRVRVGDSLIDTSVATKLTALRESLATAVR